MTLAIAGIRRIRDCEELIVASDSRLSGGRTIDCCAKIIPLPRSDVFLCCAGETDFTYPLGLQVAIAISSYQRSISRAQDVRALKSHLLKILNRAISEVAVPESIAELRYPKKFTEFLFGGYSWEAKEFAIWKLHFCKSESVFQSIPARPWGKKGSPIMFAGDFQRVAKDRLFALIRARHNITPQSAKNFYFNWEPFEILRDLLRENRHNHAASIGGPPQILKIYQHLNYRHIGVYWPNQQEGNVTIAGRRILDYERPECWILDPDTLLTSNIFQSASNEDQPPLNLDATT
jgi:hypothetical protein